MTRQTYTLTQADYDRIAERINSARPMSSVQEIINASWCELGSRMGFNGMSVRPGNSPLHFSAEPLDRTTLKTELSKEKEAVNNPYPPKELPMPKYKYQDSNEIGISSRAKPEKDANEVGISSRAKPEQDFGWPDDDWFCPYCHCQSWARMDVPNKGGGYKKGEGILCVHCKRSFYPYVLNIGGPIVGSTTSPPRWRPEVRAFADLMEARLQKNDHKPGWKDGPVRDLLERAYDKMGALSYVLREGPRPDLKNRVAEEAADAANFLMMVVDVCEGLPINSKESQT